MERRLSGSFKDAVEPIKGGSVYHVDCYRLQEAKNKKREERQKEEEAKKEEVKEEPQMAVKDDQIDDLISFDSFVSFNSVRLFYHCQRRVMKEFHDP